MTSRRRRRAPLGALLLLLLLALLLPLGVFLAGTFPGGGRLQTPVDGARIQVEASGDVAPPRMRRGRVHGAPAEVLLLDRDGEVLARTRTDAGGRYALEERPGAAFVAALSDGASPAVAREGDLELGNDPPCKGRMIGGGPGEVAVHALIPSSGEDEMAVLRWAAPLDGAGGFEVRLPKGARAWAVVGGRPVALREGEIELPAPARATGLILGPDGGPAAHAILRFAPLSDGGTPTPLPVTTAESDAAGRLEAPDLADIAYAVEVRARGCATTRLALFRPADGALEVRLEPGYALDGVVSDTRGLPIAGAQIRAVGVPDPDQRHPVACVTSDDRGRFHLDGLGGESAKLRITARGFHPTTLEKVGRSHAIRVALQRE